MSLKNPVQNMAPSFLVFLYYLKYQFISYRYASQNFVYPSILIKSKLNLECLILLLPLALQPTVGFGLSNNVLPFFPICHQLSLTLTPST